MKLKQAIVADVRKEGAWEGIHTWLFKIPPLKKYGPVGSAPIEALEKMMQVFEKKYDVQLQYIIHSPQKDAKGQETFNYSCSLKNKKTNKWIDTVYGLSIYECFAKMVLLSYGYIKSQQK